MDAFNPSDFPLPAFLDPVLDFLADRLPPPLYSLLLSFLSRVLAVLSSLLSLILSLIRLKPSEWNAETVLPPLIMLLMSYLALVSFYRTASWMVRTGVWFVKWGTIIGAFAAGAGYLMGTQGQGGQGVGRGGAGTTGGGILATITGLALDLMKGNGQNDGGRSRSTSRDQQRGSRPKSWESFDRHRQWQYSEDADNGRERVDVGEELRKAAGEIAETIGAGNWWEIAKGYINSMGREEGAGDEAEGNSGAGRRKPSRQAKAKAKAGTSSK